MDELRDASLLWTPAGWRSDAGLETRHGRIARVLPAEPSWDGGWVLPGIANLHSHAFQRAMAGLAERQTHAQDSFWTWRETMYRIAARFDPDSLHAVAAQLYAEMLEAGYTSVCEFHYLHHAPDGRPYADPAAMSKALVAAARETGIRLTLLPVLYMTGGFDRRPLSERQRRFGHDLDGFLRLFESLREIEDDTLRVGVAFHSLRAVPPDAMDAALAALPAGIPLHIHIAEQIGEVQDCLAVRNARPVEWLLDHAPVGPDWTLVHATHLTPAETTRIAASGATVAICPTTEANLGDGLFPLRAYLGAGGAWGIGSDSHVSVSPVEELRWLEYGQRLHTRHRNIAVRADSTSVGETLLHGTLASAARATGQPVGVLEPGQAADWIALDPKAPAFAGARAQDVVDRWLFAGNRNLVREVQVAGQVVVSAGRHRHHEAIADRYRKSITALLAG
ncbi:formimidoylglutamate deiminase [Pseudoxanthomonas daejeonensis]|uniref:Formimidoylglutamate deiminase n=1 Tax=Pseudoxanthomonas daejeonensis TaxID=266062 RepID=A0ABQ6Z5T6_9GAMM|nr:formimidoylglutamate deiminase [Pseudoxanthomonas daejeonensis]KAF1693555.1 formimidoylglutamate deiminase [Pseudoxanthomonas daejeonensis]UNK57943.1 formimidoylglutamate deiminase [Pseudoxanthomonas daejeonensis]